MHSASVQIDVRTVIWLLILSFAALLVVRRTRLPYTVALVVVGLVVGATGALRAFPLSNELVFNILLPPLLFDAAIRMPVHLFKRNWVQIAILVGPGVIVTALALGFSVHYLIGLPIVAALQFGALISATDPAAVIARFRRLQTDRNLNSIVEGEGMFNDGTATVLFVSLAGGAAALTAIHPAQVTLQILKATLGGVIVGAVVGYGISLIMARINDHLAEITLTTIAAYGASIVATSFSASGVISVIVSGMVLGYYRGATVMSPTTRSAVYSFWEYAAFAVNSILFLLVGIDITLGTLRSQITAIAVAIGLVIVTRAIVVYGTGLSLRCTVYRIPLNWLHVINAAGLRGALAIALAISLPPSPAATTVVAMTYGVVLWTLLPQGLSVGWLMGALGLRQGEVHAEYQRMVGLWQARRAALARLDELYAQGLVSSGTRQEYHDRLAGDLERLEKDIAAYLAHHETVIQEQRREISMQLLAAQRNSVIAALSSNLISPEVAAELQEAFFEEYGDLIEEQEH